MPATVNQRSVASVSTESVHEALDLALRRVVVQDVALLRGDSSERSICFRLALYLVELFRDFDVDCEYNRLWNAQDEIKRLIHTKHTEYSRYVSGDHGDSFTVYPDIIIHRRGTDDNLLIIEVKKTSSDIPVAFDHYKLTLYKQQLSYRHAAFIRFDVFPHDPGIAELRYF